MVVHIEDICQSWKEGPDPGPLSTFEYLEGTWQGKGQPLAGHLAVVNCGCRRHVMWPCFAHILNVPLYKHVPPFPHGDLWS